MRVRPRMIRHLDKEMAQALLLGEEIQHPTMTYSPVVGAAMRTTFCFHYRALLEFFHNGRSELISKASDPQKNALLVKHVLPAGTELGIRVNQYERQRFLAADILTSHLGTHRTRYEKLALGWGCWKDQLALKRRVASLLNLIPNSAILFPETAAVLHKGASPAR